MVAVVTSGLLNKSVAYADWYVDPTIPTLIFQEDFSSNAKPASPWNSGSQNGGTITYANGYVEAVIPANSNGINVWAGYDISALNVREVFIEFDARIPGPIHGFKFLKIFSKSGAGFTGYANTTFALDYTGIDNGSMRAVSFGDGSSTENDTAQTIQFQGTNPNFIGRNFGSATVLTPHGAVFSSAEWGTAWHHFKFRVKMNQGTTAENEVPDGAYYVEIDGNVYVDATGLFNRHYLNSQHIRNLSLIDVAQQVGAETYPNIEVNYDNIVISTGGFL